MLIIKAEIIVPDVIILKSDVAERIIRLENCHGQNETMENLKICCTLSRKNMENSELNLKI